jgi:biofilm PGA synthesis N-glycosyltransferase PgaC
MSLITEKIKKLTVIIPAYNEETHIADTIKSVMNQTITPAEIIVVDDFSSDRTGEIARSFGVKVLRPPKNTGTKAGAQNFALIGVNTDYVMAIDADTTLAPNAIEKLMTGFKSDKVAAVCGFVIPRFVKTIWERGRYVEYLFAFSFFKQIQEYFDKPLISSGCFSAYRTEILKSVGGWPTRTMAEDMDLTWTFYHHDYKVHFVPDAVCYPVEPHNLHFMGKQLRRWSHGFLQNVKLHWKSVIHIPFLRNVVAVGLWDASIASVAYLFVLPLLAVIFSNPWLFLGYFIDMPTVLFPVMVTAVKRKEIPKAVLSIPSFFILRFVNSFFMLRAIWEEFVINKPLTQYEKGH